MPLITATTKEAEQVWQSPDGQRTIYKLTLDYNGQPVSASTYSKVIATVGWSGEVETYEKPNKNGQGSQTFVKQPPKEGGGNYGSAGKSYGAASPKADPFTMYLSYAKDIAVALIGAKGYTPERLSEVIAAVSLAGEQLYDSRPDSPTRQAERTGEDAPKKLDEVHTVTDKPIDLGLVDKVFNTDSEQEEETPWPRK